jgi:hypothetical protein
MRSFFPCSKSEQTPRYTWVICKYLYSAATLARSMHTPAHSTKNTKIHVNVILFSAKVLDCHTF